MVYSVIEFRQNIRKILNEALQHPITIKRYDDEFVLMAASEYKPSTNNLQAQVKQVKEIIDKPAKSKANWCKEHDMEKEFCSNMKHKGA